MEHEARVASALMGGLIMGVWFYGVLWGFGDGMEVSGWMIWGLLGLVLAGAVYGSRATQDHLRIALVAIIGAVTAMVTMGAIIQENIHVLATVTTMLGGSLIGSALPIPSLSPPPAPQEEPAEN